MKFWIILFCTQSCGFTINNKKKWTPPLLHHIKRLRKRRPPYVLTDVEPTVGHQVLTDRVHIPELGRRTNPRQTPRTEAEGPKT